MVQLGFVECVSVPSPRRVRVKPNKIDRDWVNIQKPKSPKSRTRRTTFLPLKVTSSMFTPFGSMGRLLGLLGGKAKV